MTSVRAILMSTQNAKQSPMQKVNRIQAANVNKVYIIIFEF